MPCPKWAFVPVLSMLLIVVLPSMAKASPPDLPPAMAEAMGRAHSHNDYEQEHPLQDALDQQFSSVEADVWLSDGLVLVSHAGLWFAGSLEELYLAPLQELVEKRGSVYGDGRPFYLWIDLKEGSPQLSEALNAILNRYPMLTVFSEQGVHQGPVTAILTGNDGCKRRFVEEHSTRRACRDEGEFEASDPPADAKWQWYAIECEDEMSHPGILSKLAAGIHAKGRRLRLYGVPQLTRVWQLLLEAGVDQISVDDLPGMHRFLHLFATHPTTPRAG